MSQFLDRPYNFEVWSPSDVLWTHFTTVVHAGDRAPDFTLPTLDGNQVALSRLRGKPVMVEFGSTT